MNAIASFLINIVTTLFTSFIIPLGKAIWKFIMDPINRLLYEVIKVLMQLLDGLQDAVGVFAGTQAISYQGEEIYLLDLVFFRSDLSVILWGVTLVAMVLAGYFAVASLRNAASENVPAGKTLAAAAKSMITFLLLPVLMLAAIKATSVVLDSTSRMIGSQGYGEESVKISGMVFTAATLGAENSKTYTDEIRQKYTTGQLDYMDSETVFKYFEPGKINLVPSVAVAVYFIVVYAIVCFLFVGRCIQLLLLYLAAPYYAAFIPLDDGEKFNAWRDSLVGKLASGFGLAISLEIFGTVIMPLYASSAIQFSGGELSDFAFRLLFMAGSAYAITKCYTVLVQAISPQMAHHESMYGDAVTAAVSMAVGGPARMGAAKGSSLMTQQMLLQSAQSMKNRSDPGSS